MLSLPGLGSSNLALADWTFKGGHSSLLQLVEFYVSCRAGKDGYWRSLAWLCVRLADEARMEW